MNRTTRTNVATYGTAGVGASAYWSSVRSAGLDRHAAMWAMAVKPAFIAAQRPRGLAGVSTG